MATIDYTAKRATAERLIKKFGAAGEFILKGSAGGYDAYGNVAADTGDVIISGTVTPLLPFSPTIEEQTNSAILSSDKHCLFHSETKPEIGYTHTQNGNEYRVVAILSEIESVDGVVVFTQLQLRK